MLFSRNHNFVLFNHNTTLTRTGIESNLILTSSLCKVKGLRLILTDRKLRELKHMMQQKNTMMQQKTTIKVVIKKYYIPIKLCNSRYDK